MLFIKHTHTFNEPFIEFLTKIFVGCSIFRKRKHVISIIGGTQSPEHLSGLTTFYFCLDTQNFLFHINQYNTVLLHRLV